MTPTIPLSPAETLALPAHVAAAWKEAAARAGIKHAICTVSEDGVLCMRVALAPIGPMHQRQQREEMPRWEQAREEVARSLAWEHGYAVDGGRVVGWAAAKERERILCGDERCMARHDHGERLRLIRIRDLPPIDDRAQAWRDALRGARAAAGPAPNAKLEGAAERDRAAYGRGARR